MIRFSVLNEHGCACGSPHPHLDEFVSDEVTSVHFEAMGDAQFWMVIRCRDGHEYTINCGAVSTRARGYCTLEIDQ